MYKINIPATNETPNVILKKNENTLYISGRCLLIKPQSWFNNLKTTISPYLQDGTIKTLNHFWDYFNTASTRQIYLLMSECLKYNISIEWTFHANDDDLEEIGKDFEAILKTNFKFIEYSDTSN